MPTLLRWRGYRFFFFSADRWEPPHVHVEKVGHQAKLWLSDLRVAINTGFRTPELNDIIRKVRQERENFLESWNDYFAKRGE